MKRVVGPWFRTGDRGASAARRLAGLDSGDSGAVAADLTGIAACQRGRDPGCELGRHAARIDRRGIRGAADSRPGAGRHRVSRPDAAAAGAVGPRVASHRRASAAHGAFGVLAIAAVVWSLAPPGWPARGRGAVALLPLPVRPGERPTAGDLWVTALDVGQGRRSCWRHDRVWLYGAGPRYSADADASERVVLPYLRRRRVEALDGMVVSHLDQDHSDGAAPSCAGSRTGKSSAQLRLGTLRWEGLRRSTGARPGTPFRQASWRCMSSIRWRRITSGGHRRMR